MIHLPGFWFNCGTGTGNCFGNGNSYGSFLCYNDGNGWGDGYGWNNGDGFGDGYKYDGLFEEIVFVPEDNGE